MMNNVQKHIRGLNVEIKDLLMDTGVVYHNAYASLVDNHTVDLRNKDNIVKRKTAK